jgi:hypothetical protein
MSAVDDERARGFASIAHMHLAAGQTLGDAMRTARAALYEKHKPDWGNFLLYGDDGLILRDYIAVDKRTPIVLHSSSIFLNFLCRKRSPPSPIDVETRGQHLARVKE